MNPRYIGPELQSYPDGSWDGIFGERYKNIAFPGGVYAEAVYLPFAGVEDVEELDSLPMPSPQWYDCASVEEQCQKYAGYAPIAGIPVLRILSMVSPACRGVEQVILDMGLKSPVFLELVERRFQFSMRKPKRRSRQEGGKIDIVHFGDDLGTQNGPLISPRHL